MFSSTDTNRVNFCKDELIMKFDHPSDEYDFSIFQFTYQFRTGIFVVRTSYSLEIQVLKMSKNFPLTASLFKALLNNCFSYSITICKTALGLVSCDRARPKKEYLLLKVIVDSQI